MAAATFRTRPWHMPLVLRQTLSAPAPKSIPSVLAASRQLSTTSQRCKKSSTRMQRKVSRGHTAGAQQAGPSPVSQSFNSSDGVKGLPSEMISMRAPYTFVTPPFTKYLSQPLNFLYLLKTRLYNHAKDRFNLAMYRFSSKPGYLKAARLKLQRSSLVPTAKALHAAMSDALAAGDKDALRKVVVQRLYNQLAPSIDARRRGRRLEWSLVRYNRPLFYPRLVDHKIMMMQNPGGGSTVVWRQAVVAIASRQRLVEFDDNLGGVEVVGGTRETDSLEYLILVAGVDGRDFTTKEWRIFGYADETTPEAWKEEVRGVEAMEQERLAKFKK